LSAGSYGQFLHENNLISDAQLFNFTEAFRTLYVPLVEEEKWAEALKVDNQLLEDISAAAGVPNNFNIRQPSTPLDEEREATLTEFLQNTRTRRSLHVPRGVMWSNGDAPYAALSKDQEQSALTALGLVLRHFPVLLFNGDLDVVCNFIGTASFTRHALEWPGRDAFNAAPERIWTVEGTAVESNTAGYWKTGGNLTLMVVFDAGHNTARDQPEHIRTLVTQFTTGSGPFAHPP
jgi:hypothetical protein